MSRPLAAARVALALALLGAAAALAGAGDAAPQRAGDDVVVRRLGPDVWMHTSWSVLPDGARYPSNGLLVRDGDGLLLVDTAWGEVPTEDLLAWAADHLPQPVRRAVATHAHDDRIGGATALRRRGIPLWVHPDTADRAAAKGVQGLERLAAISRGEATTLGAVEVFHPGPGHAADNVLVWLPEQRVLFGGCAVKDRSATTLGNVADADLERWPDAIRAARARYEAAVVVPGHGEPGGMDLLDHTLALLAGARRQ